MAECQWVVGVRGSVLLPTGLAGFGTDCYVTITTQPFLPVGLICRSSLLSSACTFVPFSFVSVNVFILLPLSITAPCITEYDSELLRTLYCMHQFTVPVQLTLGGVILHCLH